MTITGLLFSQKINDRYWIASREIHNEIIHQNIQLYACIKPNNYIKKHSSIRKESNQPRVLFVFKKVDLYQIWLDPYHPLLKL